MAEQLLMFDGKVLPEWIDYNGHMNDACYVIAFSDAIDKLMVYIGLDESFRAEHEVSIYTLQAMVHYLQEVAEGEPIQIHAQLLESDNKKLRVFYTMRHGETGMELAAMETLLLHMNMAERRAAPFLPATAERVERLQAEHDLLEWPALAGRAIAMKKPT